MVHLLTRCCYSFSNTGQIWPSHTNMSILINRTTGEKRHTCLFFSTFSIVLQFITCIFVIACAQGCPQYWPEEGMLRYGPVQVECMSCSMDCDVISRLFRVCNLTRVSTTLFFLSFLANSCFVCFFSVCDWPDKSTLRSLSRRKATWWFASSSTWDGRGTEKCPPPSVPSSSWSCRWTSGSARARRARAEPLCTACECQRGLNQFFHK